MDSLDLVLNGTRYVCTLVTEQPAPSTIIAYSQNDPLWRDQIYAHSFTFGKAGCLVVCVTMMVSTVYAERILPPEVATSLNRAGAFVGDLLSRPSRIPDAYPRLSWDGVVHFRDKPADMAFIQSELLKAPLIAEVAWNPLGASPATGNQHFVILEALVGDKAFIIDPWDGEEKLLSASRYSLPGWTAARTITGLRLVRPANIL